MIFYEEESKMGNNVFSWNVSETMKETYYEPIIEEFNLAPFYGNVTSKNDIDDNEILDEYLKRFEDAWKELAEK